MKAIVTIIIAGTLVLLTGTTVLQGIKDKLKGTTKIFYSGATDFVDTTDPDFSKLIDSLKDADVLIYVGGISPRLEGEEMKG